MLITPLKKRPIYYREEADKLGIKYKHWSEFPHEKGDWIITDDDKVMEILGVSIPKNRKKKFFYKTAVGTLAATTKKFSYEAMKKRCNTFKGSGVEYKTTLTPKDKIMANLIAMGASPVLVARLLWPRRKRISSKVNMLMKTEVFISYLRECMMNNYEEILKKSGITKEDLLQSVHRIASSARALDDPKYAEISLKALTGLLALYGITSEQDNKEKGAVMLKAVRETHISKSLLNDLQSERDAKMLTEYTENDD